MKVWNSWWSAQLDTFARLSSATFPTFADEEVFFEHNNSSPEDEEFDTIVSALEEILQDDGFQALLNSFYQDNCGSFHASNLAYG